MRSPYKRDALPKLGQQVLQVLTGRQFVDRPDRRALLEALRQEIGGLSRANEGAGIDLVEADAEPHEPLYDLFETAHALACQRTFGVVGPVVATLGRHGVSDQVELAGSHIGERRLNHTTAM